MSLLAVISLFSIALGVFILVLIQSVMGAFGQDLQKKILRLSNPLILKPQNSALYSSLENPLKDKDGGIQKIYPFFETEVILKTVGEGASQGIKLRAVETEHMSEKVQIDYAADFSAQDFDSKNEEYPGIVLGSELIDRLNVLPQLGEEVDLIYPFGEVDPSGEMRPKTRRFRVIGSFKTGYLDYDQKYGMLALDQARRLVPSAEVPYSWAIEIKDFWKTEALAAALRKSLEGDYEVETWSQKNKRLLGALTLERQVMFVVLMFMILIASFNLFTLTFMLIAQKSEEIALLRVLGLSQAKIEGLFSYIGLTLGFWGASVGVLLAFAAELYLKNNPLPLPSSYYLDSLPVQFNPAFMAGVWFLALLLACLSAWLPARMLRKNEEGLLIKI